MSDPHSICVGAIQGSYGVRGLVRLKSFCAEPAMIGSYSPLKSEDGKQSFDLQITGAVKAGFTANIKGIKDKEQAEALRGIRLFASRDQLPNLPDDEYYHADLIGLSVRDTGGADLGEITAVLDHGAGDLLEIVGPGLKSSVLLPFTKAAVPTIDLAAGCVIADPPDGVFADATP